MTTEELIAALREPVMYHSSAEQTNAQRRLAADRLERLAGALRNISRRAEDQNTSHVDFRVGARHAADAALSQEKQT